MSEEYKEVEVPPEDLQRIKDARSFAQIKELEFQNAQLKLQLQVALVAGGLGCIQGILDMDEGVIKTQPS